jgi:hypothetical protein
MSLAERLAAETVKVRSDARILTIDIERLPGRARMQHRGLTIEGDFWDLGGWKYVIGRRIHADDVIEWPRTICAAWKWHGVKTVQFAAEWLDGGNEAMVRATWEAYDQADIVVGHNLAGFDTKKLRGAWLEHGLPEPTPFKTIDTLKVGREFGFESNTLDALCQRLGIPAKTDRYNVEVARAACAGNVTAQRRITRYNKGDIVATEGLYDYFRGHMPSHPHIAPAGVDPTCNQCGSTELTLSAKPHRAQALAYPLYRCDNCGANVRLNRHDRRIASTYGVR